MRKEYYQLECGDPEAQRRYEAVIDKIDQALPGAKRGGYRHSSRKPKIEVEQKVTKNA
jgi:hypothetical protein